MHQHVAYSLEEWSSLVSSSFVPLTAEVSAKKPFVGNLSARNFGDLAVHQIDATPQTIERDCAVARSDNPAYYKISFQQTGQCLLIQDGREVVLEPGQFAIYDTSRPYTLMFDKDFSTTVMMAPRVFLGSESYGLSQLTAVGLGERHQLSSPIARLMEYAGQSLINLSQGVGNRLVLTVIDLLKEVLVAELHPASCLSGLPPSKDQRMLNAVLAYIDQRLADPQLNPKQVAAAHYISLRSLHQLFENNNNTVAATIREKRLERCYEDLLRPSQRDVPVAAIGARWGFQDPAYFSRIFKQKYGVSPSGFRA